MNIEMINRLQDELTNWAQARDAINARKSNRRGGALGSEPLLDAVRFLNDFRGVLNRLDVARTAFEKDEAVVALLDSIRDGYPVKTAALRELLHPIPKVTLGCDAPGCQGCRDVPAQPLRGSGWGTG